VKSEVNNTSIALAILTLLSTLLSTLLFTLLFLTTQIIIPSYQIG
jgi:hypothetical protein